MVCLLNIKNKSIVSFLIALIIVFFLNFNAFSDEVIDEIGLKFSKSVVKKIKKLQEDTKIAVVFLQDYTNSETVNTRLGIELTKSIVEYLKIELEKDKSSIKILFNDNIDNILYDKMQDLFFMPSDENEAEYWKKFLENQTPNYYLTANYQFLDNSIKIRNIKLLQSVFEGNDEIVFDQIEIDLEPDDLDLLLDYNKNTLDLSDIYLSLINWESDNVFLVTDVTNDKKEIVSSKILFAENKYKLQVNLTEDLYVYCFYYEQEEESNEIYMIYPFRNNQENILKAGTHFIPEGFYLQPSLPGNNQIYIKILVSREKIPITIESDMTEKGGTAPILSEENCKLFINDINRRKISDFGTKDYTFFIKVE